MKLQPTAIATSVALTMLALAVGRAMGEGPRGAGRKVVQAGEVVVPSVVLRDIGPKGKIIDLGMLCGPGARFVPKRPKAILLDFYTTTCVPCNQGLPVLGKVATEYRDEGLRTVLVALDPTGEVGNRALGEKVLPSGLLPREVGRDPGWLLAERFGLVQERRNEAGRVVSREVGVPRTFVLDQDCKVVAVLADISKRGPELTGILRRLLGGSSRAVRPGEGPKTERTETRSGGRR